MSAEQIAQELRLAELRETIDTHMMDGSARRALHAVVARLEAGAEAPRLWIACDDERMVKIGTLAALKASDVASIKKDPTGLVRKILQAVRAAQLEARQ